MFVIFRLIDSQLNFAKLTQKNINLKQNVSDTVNSRYNEVLGDIGSQSSL